MTSNRFDLSGKVAIVTGGNGGIGLGMARGLADAGADIAVVGRNEAKSAAAVAELKARGVKAIAVATMSPTRRPSRRWSSASQASSAASTSWSTTPASTSASRRTSSSSTSGTAVIDTNLTSAFLCSKAVYPAMKKAGGGKIINIGSMMSIFGASFAPAYAASKGGIVQFTRACAMAWAADNIQVNAILPGWIDTDLTKRAREQMRPARARARAHAGGALGRHRRLRRHRRVSRLARLGLRHRHRHPRRRRLLGDGLTCANKKAPAMPGL